MGLGTSIKCHGATVYTRCPAAFVTLSPCLVAVVIYAATNGNEETKMIRKIPMALVCAAALSAPTPQRHVKCALPSQRRLI